MTASTQRWEKTSNVSMSFSISRKRRSAWGQTFSTGFKSGECGGHLGKIVMCFSRKAALAGGEWKIFDMCRS